MTSNSIALTVEWRVRPGHAAQLPVQAQPPALPIATAPPALGDLVEIAPGCFWVIAARQWERHSQQHKLVLLIAPSTDSHDSQGQVLH